jgi:hypothetical protein
MHLEDASYSSRATWQYWSVAVVAALRWATASGRTKRLASLIICISRLKAVPHALLPFDTWPTWAYPPHYMAALASSAFSMLRLFPPPCGWGDHDPRGPRTQRFHVLHSIRDGFRSALLHRQFCECAPGHVGRPGLDCPPFGSSLKQPRMAGFAFTMLASVQLV